MIRSGYDIRLLFRRHCGWRHPGILIPPSVMLVVMGPVLSISVVKLYAAAFGPGFLMAFLYIAYCLFLSYKNPQLGPALPMEERAESTFQVVKAVLVGMVPQKSSILATLGSILEDWQTPSEAAAIGALGATILVLPMGS